MRRFALLLICLLFAAAPAFAAPKHSSPARQATAKATKVVRKASPAKHKTAKITKPQDGTAAWYRRAFAVVNEGKTDLAEALVDKGPDRVLNKVLRGYIMALPGNDYSFDQLNIFISENPSWPGLKGIQMIAEQKLPSNMPASQLLAYFSEHPPLTLAGFYRYVDALNQLGMSTKAQNAVRARWIKDDLTVDEQTAFYARFGGWLSASDMWERTDRLLWRNDFSEARRMAPYLGETDKTLLDARISLASGDGNAAAWSSRIGTDARNDPGLLYQRLRWDVKNNRDDNAEELLLNPPSDLGHPEAWWEQRAIVVRRAIERKDFALAYRLASLHGQATPKTVAQAEFLSGWLALRFLNKPEAAIRHFQALYTTASTPVSRARGAYWLGRTYEVLGDKVDAEQAYEDASVFNTTFYGQLAATRIFASPVLAVKSDPPIPDAVRKSFFARDQIRAIVRLHAIGEYDRANAFFRASAERASKRAEFVLLAEVAGQLRRPDLGIQAVKAAHQKNFLVHNGGFPLITIHVPSPPEAAFTHAMIRQESMFKPDATSSAGARGLMQLMPRTAKDMCRKVGLTYSEARLGEPSYNLQLGTGFASQQIERFDGSYILALAGYNAGPGRVREWIEEFGDPRTSNVDPIDWIEMIPISETRNYVQRIIESIQVYRAKLAGGRSPLMIASDLGYKPITSSAR
ncbi:MAG: lytic transglycosylase domain-containing protein [Alphaproteobacteria bacterium]|nr:lytic transglycosylase domain-containing protein [Alphaproteobacteria bacterium]